MVNRIQLERNVALAKGIQVTSLYPFFYVHLLAFLSRFHYFSASTKRTIAGLPCSLSRVDVLGHRVPSPNVQSRVERKLARGDSRSRPAQTSSRRNEDQTGHGFCRSGKLIWDGFYGLPDVYLLL